MARVIRRKVGGCLVRSVKLRWKNVRRGLTSLGLHDLTIDTFRAAIEMILKDQRDRVEDFFYECLEVPGKVESTDCPRIYKIGLWEDFARLLCYTTNAFLHDSPHIQKIVEEFIEKERYPNGLLAVEVVLQKDGPVLIQ